MDICGKSSTIQTTLKAALERGSFILVSLSLRVAKRLLWPIAPFPGLIEMAAIEG
jgi:hypothetical protein